MSPKPFSMVLWGNLTPSILRCVGKFHLLCSWYNTWLEIIVMKRNERICLVYNLFVVFDFNNLRLFNVYVFDNGRGYSSDLNPLLCHFSYYLKYGNSFSEIIKVTTLTSNRTRWQLRHNNCDMSTNRMSNQIVENKSTTLTNIWKVFYQNGENYSNNEMRADNVFQK